MIKTIVYCPPLYVSISCSYFYYEIVAHGKNIFVKFPLFVYNHQLFFTFVLSFSPYTNDNDNNISKGPTSDWTFEFSIGMYVKTYEPIQVGNFESMTRWLSINYNDMYVTFFKAPLGFWFYSKTFHYHTYSYGKNCSCIFIWGDFTFKVIVVKATLFNKSQCTLNSLDLPWSHLHFHQKCYTYWIFFLQMQHR